MSTPDTAQSSSDRVITTRRLRFDFRRDTVPRYFVDDNIVGSHLVALASATFPRGEDFFVHSVRNYRDRITDPVLKKQVGGFIGQESVHGREHEEFNELLWKYGYPTLIVDKMTEVGLGFRAKLPGNKAKLAMTAALEHYTATFAASLLADDHAERYMPADEVRQFWAWHAMEESEHKAVAFDVYRAVGGSERMRVIVMNAVTVGVLAGLVVGTTLSVLFDKRAWRSPRRVWRDLRRTLDSPFVGPEVWAALRDYNRPDFRPDDHDHAELLDRWRTELFGDAGTLTDRIPVRAA